MLTYALRYLAAGLCPIPLWNDEYKNPKLTDVEQYHHRLPSHTEVRRWWSKWPMANIGLITGYHNGYCGLDFDSIEDYEAWQGPKGQSWTVQTGRGYHVWFQVDSELGPSKMFTDGKHEVLLRAKGGYLIAPPSRHYTGCYYKTVHKIVPLRIGQIEDAIWPWKPKTTPQPTKPTPPPKWTNSVGQGVKIEELVPPKSEKPNARGAYLASCPFHDDKKPSAWINIEQQRFGCNACWSGQWWDLVNVWAMLNGISNGEAYKQVTRVAK